MIDPPDVAQVRQFLARVRRRTSLVAALEAAAAGFAAAIVLLIGSWIGGWPPAITWAASGGLVAAATLARWWHADRRRQSAPLVERRVPECRHALITAAELIDDPSRANAYVAGAVCREAARVVAPIDVARVFPARRATGRLALAVFGFAAAAVLVARSGPAPRFPGSDRSRDRAPAVSTVRIIITPPEYTGRPVVTLEDPPRVDVLSGSRLHIVVSAGDAAAVTLETVLGRQPLAADASHAFVGDITADADGFLAFQPAAADGREGPRRLVGLGAIPDRPPVVRVTKPGKDLFISDTGRTLSVGIEARDDLALASLRLIYTKVSGSGENFEFADGEVPVRLSKTDARAWMGDAEWNLAGLKLEPGDMIVYRGIASDSRPGAARVESDAFIVEILAPGATAAEGFAVDDDKDRYALSQRMIIIKTEQLVARRASLTAEAFSNEAAGIASEQRQVRAVFVFMLGGELADDPSAGGLLNEEVEAQGEADLLAGRMRNKGRGDLLIAIRRMSEASAALAVPNTGTALTAEHAALDALQSAFTKSRYILRTLTQRESLDLSRRLGGKLTDIARGPRLALAPEVDPRLADLRRALSDVAGLVGRTAYGPSDARDATTAAQAVLHADPSAKATQAVASQLGNAAAAMTRGAAAEARRLLDDAATALTTAIRDQLPDAPKPAVGAETARLSGALADALRRKGGS